ncbi:33925_t:CDS:2 [Racocetra persica]|uniref:33925_t:CDS:1 n=1 Tax=Racocetra persica TaxID=160502 RepID=A0ACA9RS29_9GLOM|nr:33925_t:CDS:2 [Racocetra persica]
MHHLIKYGIPNHVTFSPHSEAESCPDSRSNELNISTNAAEIIEEQTMAYVAFRP